MAVSLDSQALDVEFTCCARFGLAFEQNAIPLVSEIHLFNRGSEVLTDLVLELQLAPVFGELQVFRLPALPPGERLTLPPSNFALPVGALRAVRETERATLAWRILAGSRLVAGGEAPVEVLPFNHWPGEAKMLAAYVLPNHPAIGSVLRRTAEHMKALTGDPALEGYQAKDPARIAAMARALYEALQGFALTYLSAPVGFDNGQKIRLPDAVFQDRLACCLDIAVLVAACLEAMRLHPVLFVIEGHAFAGVWLAPEEFPEGVVEHAARLRNEIALGRILAFDSSTMLQDPPVPFADAVRQADAYLALDAGFHYALDIHVARRAPIRPLSLRDERTGDSDGPEDGGALTQAPNVVVSGEGRSTSPALVAPVDPEVRARFARWQERLLDLSLRNRLLNFNPEGKTGVALHVPDLALFEDMVALPRSFQFRPWPEELGLAGQSAPLMQRRGLVAQHEAQLRQALADGLLITGCSSPVLLTTLKGIDRQARSDYEEGGAHTLYLALGLLAYYETPQSTQPRFAPLLLYPVQLTFDRAKQAFSVRRTADEPIANVTLVEKLKQDFGLDIAGLTQIDSDESAGSGSHRRGGDKTDEMGLDLAKLLNAVRVGISSQPRWEVLEQAHVGLFSFTKFLMWKDLQDNREALLQSDVVRHLATRSALGYRQAHDAIAPADLDRALPSAALPCVLDADSTQLAAVASALAGRSFVLQGPPGTGKSQTITSMIAALLGNGKRVLFVSEKMAALEVVKRRLEDVGLADFVLELHDPSTDKKKTLESLKRVYWRGGRVGEVPWEVRARELDGLRDRLNALAAALHAPRPVGLSFHEAVCRLLALADAPDIRVGLANAVGLDQETYRGMRQAAADFAERAAPVEPAATHPWAGTAPGAWSAKGQEELEDCLHEALAAVRNLEQVRPALVAAFGLAASVPLPAVEAAAALALTMADLATRWPPSFLATPAMEICVRLRMALAQPAWLRFFTFWGERRRLRALALVRPACDAAIAADAERLLACQQEAVRWGIRLPQVGEGLARVGREVADALGELTAAEAAVKALLGPHPSLAWTRRDDPRFSATFTAAIAHFLAHMPRFRAWAFYSQAASELQALGLGAIADAHLAGPLPASQAAEACERGVLWRWLVATRDATPVLAAFDGAEHERQIEKFRGFDEAFKATSRRYIIAQLESRLPNPQSAPLESSEPGILLHEAKKQRGHRPLRKLFLAIPKLVAALKPCLMMSPLSIAQYLPAESRTEGPLSPRFDVVIFDEASQMATHDAIGAIARGNQVIVVGDSKQLPPTTFFQRRVDDDDLPDENDLVELESVLDEALAKQLPELSLGWHYRSQHDALIDFSNRHYYGGKLMIFPAARRFVENLGVKWHPVPEGVYVTAKGDGVAGTNPAEARALVAHLVATLRATPPGTRTFGVVTFSMAQQTVILELLDEARARHPDIEGHFLDAEPLFVKNLENVQGDERDEIYFSICYARDAAGKLRMNFGPLSLQGGERRLNVAVTRARCLLRVFSTLTHDQIDPQRARATGARHLGQFLRDAAQQGGDGGAEAAGLRVPETALASSIQAYLVGQGFSVHAQVGCGDYRVELAICHPALPGEYVLGVETDGAYYHTAPTARDRDRIRQMVLKTLGWQTYRIWALDWFSDRQIQEGRLSAAIQNALATHNEPVARPRVEIVVTAETAELPRVEALQPPPAMPPARPYQVTLLSALGTDAEALYAVVSTAALRSAIATVIQLEGPIHADLLCRRIMAAFGVTRLTDTVRRRVLDEVREGVRRGEFYWPAALAPEALTTFRVGSREPEHWPTEEVALALGWLLEQGLTVPREAAVREVARLFGLKVSKAVVTAFERGLAHLIEKGRCRETDTLLEWH